MLERIRRLGRASVQAFHAMNTERRIRVTKKLYFQVPKLKIDLVSLVDDDSRTFELAIPEARIVFQSMKRALESRQLDQIEFKEFVWTTDCRVHADDQERVTIQLKSANRSVQTVLRRADLAATISEFEHKLFAAL